MQVDEQTLYFSDQGKVLILKVTEMETLSPESFAWILNGKRPWPNESLREKGTTVDLLLP